MFEHALSYPLRKWYGNSHQISQILNLLCEKIMGQKRDHHRVALKDDQVVCNIRSHAYTTQRLGTHYERILKMHWITQWMIFLCITSCLFVRLRLVSHWIITDRQSTTHFTLLILLIPDKSFAVLLRSTQIWAYSSSSQKQYQRELYSSR